MRQVVLSPDAARQFRRLPARDRSLLRVTLREQLGEADAAAETRNRFRLRRPSAVAEFELRVEEMRVFYRVKRRVVEVVLIGRKRGNELFIDGKRFVL